MKISPNRRENTTIYIFIEKEKRALGIKFEFAHPSDHRADLRSRVLGTHRF